MSGIEHAAAHAADGPGHSGAPLTRRSTGTATGTRAEERQTNTAPRRQELAQPAVTTGTQIFTLDDESVLVTGMRPTCLDEPRGSQERVQTVEQLADLAPMVQFLDALVPQSEAQLVDTFKHIDISVLEQVIEVPKILCPA